MKKLKNTVTNKKSLFPLLSIFFVLVVWEFIVWIYKIVPWILPSPSLVLISLFQQKNVLWMHTKITLIEASIGFIIAIIFAFILAFLMDSVSWIKKSFYPLLIISQTIPIITIAPLLVIWFGYDLAPKIFVVILVCFFPITINLLQGLESADPETISLLKIMGANRYQLFRYIKLPGALPGIFSGLKISATYSIMGAVIGEWLGAKSGLGEYMRRSMRSFSVANTFASIVVITLLSFIFLSIIQVIEYWKMPWNRKHPSWMD
jgi:ABC-type nitrate/sulfonate/bicarbonate transport system permease component